MLIGKNIIAICKYVCGSLSNFCVVFMPRGKCLIYERKCRLSLQATVNLPNEYKCLFFSAKIMSCVTIRRLATNSALMLLMYTNYDMLLFIQTLHTYIYIEAKTFQGRG